MYLSRFFGLVSLCVATVLPSIALSQEAATAGPEHAVLKSMAGTWDAEIDSAGEKSKGTSIMSLDCNGLWLTTKFSGDFGGTTFEGRGLDGYDQSKKKYVSVWVDSMTSGLTLFEGTHDDRTKTITMTGSSTGPDGAPMKLKSTTTQNSPDSITFKMLMVTPDGEFPMMTIEYKRKK